MEQENKILGKFSLICLICIFFYYFKECHSEKKDAFIKEIIDNKIITSGKVLTFSTGRSKTISYEFKCGNKIIHNSRGISIPGWAGRKIINTNWPVVYSSKHPELNFILISVENFKEFGVIKPDSLPIIERGPW